MGPSPTEWDIVSQLGPASSKYQMLRSCVVHLGIAEDSSETYSR